MSKDRVLVVRWLNGVANEWNIEDEQIHPDGTSTLTVRPKPDEDSAHPDSKEGSLMDADLVREVAEEVQASSSTYVDYKIDVVDGSLEDTIAAVLAVLERRGMMKESAT